MLRNTASIGFFLLYLQKGGGSLLRFDRSKQVVRPFLLSSITSSPLLRTQPLPRQTQLSGLLDDLLQTGVDIFQTVQQASDIGTAADRAQQLMDQLNTKYQALKAAGQLTVYVINQYQSAVRQLVSQFCNYASRTIPGQAACQQVTLSGNQTIENWELDKAVLPLTAGFSLGGNTTWILLGLAALFFLRRR